MLSAPHQRQGSVPKEPLAKRDFTAVGGSGGLLGYHFSLSVSGYTRPEVAFSYRCREPSQDARQPGRTEERGGAEPQAPLASWLTTVVQLPPDHTHTHTPRYQPAG